MWRKFKEIGCLCSWKHYMIEWTVPPGTWHWHCHINCWCDCMIWHLHWNETFTVMKHLCDVMMSINVDIKLFKSFDSISYEWLSWCHINIDTALVQCSDNVILMWHHDVLSVLIQHCSSVFTKYSINIDYIMVTHWHWYNIVPVFLTKCHKNTMTMWWDSSYFDTYCFTVLSLW